MVDRFTTKVNPDELLKVPLKTPSLYDSLADKVLVELRKGLTDEVVEQLVRLDDLPIIGLDNSTSEEKPDGKASDRKMKDDSSSLDKAEKEDGNDDEVDDGPGG